MSEELRKIREARQSRPTAVGDFGHCSFASDFPLLFALLSCEHDGEKRVERGSLIVLIEDGAYKVCVNDRQAGMVAFVTGATFAELLDRVETGLGDGSLDWRGGRAPQNGSRRTR